MNIKTELVAVTPQLAQEWLVSMPYARQRAVRRAIVEEYAESMATGLWAPGTQIVIATATGVSAIINGQHRLHAVVMSKTTQIFDVAFYLCEAEAEIDELYTKFDRGLTRAPSDAMRALQVAEALDIPSSDLNKAAYAMKVILADFTRLDGKRKVQSVIVANHLRSYGDAIRAYLSAIRDAPDPMTDALRRASVMGLGIVTMHYSATSLSKELVEEFWTGTAHNDGLKVGDPRRLAHLHLAMTRIGAQSSRGFKHVTANYQVRYVAQCFNAWMEGREIKHIKVPDQIAPIVIAGTPWQG